MMTNIDQNEKFYYDNLFGHSSTFNDSELLADDKPSSSNFAKTLTLIEDLNMKLTDYLQSRGRL